MGLVVGGVMAAEGVGARKLIDSFWVGGGGTSFYSAYVDEREGRVSLVFGRLVGLTGEARCAFKRMVAVT